MQPNGRMLAVLGTASSTEEGEEAGKREGKDRGDRKMKKGE